MWGHLASLCSLQAFIRRRKKHFSQQGYQFFFGQTFLVQKSLLAEKERQRELQ
uniref:Uncharacterized protein n=1 Tax=Rhizophora mucronata TaxID=61149 RepID=A0A2P2Q129_RHIMU